MTDRSWTHVALRENVGADARDCAKVADGRRARLVRVDVAIRVLKRVAFVVLEHDPHDAEKARHLDEDDREGADDEAEGVAHLGHLLRALARPRRLALLRVSVFVGKQVANVC